MIVGITGELYSGKEEFVDILVRSGFKWLSFRKPIEKRTIELGLEPTIRNLQRVGEEGRRNAEKDPWCEELLEEIWLNGGINHDYVAGVFKYPDQVEVFGSQDRKSFYLFAIDSPIEKRFARARADHLRIYGRKLSEEEFAAMDARDWNGHLRGDGQDVEGCFKLATHKIRNDGSPEALERTAIEVLERLREGSFKSYAEAKA